jgi:hypothetical protein
MLYAHFSQLGQLLARPLRYSTFMSGTEPLAYFPTFHLNIIILYTSPKRSFQIIQENTTYKHRRQTSMPSAGFEQATPATKRPQTYLRLRPRGHRDRRTEITVILVFSHEDVSRNTILTHCSTKIKLVNNKQGAMTSQTAGNH